MPRLRSFVLSATLLLQAACSAADSVSPRADTVADFMVQLRDVGPGEQAMDPTGSSNVVASLQLPSGGAVLFHRMPDGGVAISETAPAGQSFVAMELVSRHDATPLEIFAALSPAEAMDVAAAVPALVTDHAVHRTAPPRRLSLPTTSALLSTPGTGAYLCWPEVANPAQRWWVDWPAAFVGITTYREAAYLHSGTPTQYFYPGAGVYYGTSVNSKTYLGACNGDDPGPIDLTVEVHRRLAGAWLKVAEVSIGVGTRYTFYSAIHAAYRGYARPTNPSKPVPHYGVGAAWTISRNAIRRLE